MTDADKETRLAELSRKLNKLDYPLYTRRYRTKEKRELYKKLLNEYLDIMFTSDTERLDFLKEQISIGFGQLPMGGIGFAASDEAG